jgi:hypothetical protein
MALLASVLGRAPRRAPLVTLSAFTSGEWPRRNYRNCQEQQHGDRANEQVGARGHRNAGGHVVD